jgi:NAD-dependent DNA ligase
MAHTNMDKQIIAEITKLRAICLIHRYLYYVKAAPLVTDQWYDERERRLRELVTQTHNTCGLRQS